MAKRKKYKLNEDCKCCLHLERKLDEALKTLAKYKKQTNRLRHKLNELENYARENDYLTKMIDEVEQEIDETDINPEKFGLEQESNVIHITAADGSIRTIRKRNI